METTLNSIHSIIDNSNYGYIDNYIIADMVKEYNEYATNNPSSTDTQKMKNIVAWLRARNYVR